jgi:hypothetical protein
MKLLVMQLSLMSNKCSQKLSNFPFTLFKYYAEYSWNISLMQSENISVGRFKLKVKANLISV